MSPAILQLIETRTQTRPVQPGKQQIERRQQRIRANWTEDERVRRRSIALRRQAELMSLFEADSKAG